MSIATSIGWRPAAPSVGVGTTSAPSARSSADFSAGMEAGTMARIGRPSSAHRPASAMPVLPLVGSSTVRPSSSPRSASPASIHFAARSFTEPNGFIHSSFTYSSTPSGARRLQRDDRRGVLGVADHLGERRVALETRILAEGDRVCRSSLAPGAWGRSRRIAQGAAGMLVRGGGVVPDHMRAGRSGESR